MRRALLGLAAALALGGCGLRYPANGTCTQDSDCQLCTVCGCVRSYARSDVDTASCDDISKATSCSSISDASCPKAGSYQALCVSGHCQVLNR